VQPSGQPSKGGIKMNLGLGHPKFDFALGVLLIHGSGKWSGIFGVHFISASLKGPLRPTLVTKFKTFEPVLCVCQQGAYRCFIFYYLNQFTGELRKEKGET
jgi:hypothetical protein